MDVNGSITVNTGGVVVTNGGVNISDGLTVYGTTNMQFSPTVFSDLNLKKNVVGLSDSLEKVSRLRGVYYNWRDSSDTAEFQQFDGRRHIGVIAQEVQREYPELVSALKLNDERSDYLGVNYPEVIPVLIEAVKELDAHANELFTRLQMSKSSCSKKDLLLKIQELTRRIEIAEKWI
jgi:hypothetical protein